MAAGTIFNAWAEVSIIRSSATAIQYLHDLLTILETRRGYYWQFERGFDLVRSQAVSNNSPLINNLGYQQQAEVAISFFICLPPLRARRLDCAGGG